MGQLALLGAYRDSLYSRLIHHTTPVETFQADFCFALELDLSLDLRSWSTSH